MRVEICTAQTGSRSLDFEIPIVMDANTNLLVTSQAASNNTPTYCSFIWEEL